MLAPRAIALQGIGYRPRYVALQGLVPLDDTIRPDVIPYGRGGIVTPVKKKRRRDRDDDVLLFLLR